MTDRPQCCGECAFSHASPRNDWISYHCRLYPPVAFDNSGYATFPVVMRDSWCGQFKRKESSDDADLHF